MVRPGDLGGVESWDVDVEVGLVGRASCREGGAEWLPGGLVGCSVAASVGTSVWLRSRRHGGICIVGDGVGLLLALSEVFDCDLLSSWRSSLSCCAQLVGFPEVW